jgi:hypothetical protein
MRRVLITGGPGEIPADHPADLSLDVEIHEEGQRISWDPRDSMTACCSML